MSTTTFKVKTGTSEDWKQAKRVLEERELGLEKTTSGKYILKIGDGKTEFTQLPAVVSTPYFDDLVNEVTEKYTEIKNFESNMQTATQNANTAATNANQAKTRADTAAHACEEIVSGLNTIIDDATGTVFKMGIQNGNIYIMEDKE